MVWLVLFVGSMCELSWVICLKYSYLNSNAYLYAPMMIFMTGSIGCLGFAVKSIPAGTAYAIWTGVSTAAIAIAGIYLFAEPASLLRIISIMFIIVGVTCLRFTAKS
jgi:quaternary ammonium compound-resistance protein SugE